MDNLPKNNNQNDWLKYAGVYPSDPPKKDPTGMGGLVDNTSASGVQPAAVNPTVVPSVEPTPPPVASPVVNNNPVPETVGFNSPPVPNVNANVNPEVNPFVVTTEKKDSVPPSGAGTGNNIFKRFFIFLILIIVVGSLGFGVYKLGSKFLMKNQKITLTYWGLWENEEILKPIIDLYKEQHPQIEIVYAKQTHKDYRERLQNSIEKGVGPDIFRFHNTWIPMLKNDLMPAGKTGYQAKEFQDVFYPVASSDLIISGKVYGVPLMIDGLGLYYNEDLFRSAGITPPTTWNEFKQAAQNLRSPKTGDPLITAGAALGTANNVEHYSDIIALLMLQNGADLKNPSAKEAQDALSYYRSFAEKPNNVWDETFDNSVAAFASGRVAMIFAPSWQAFRIQELNPKLKFQIIPVPQLANGNTTWASYWVEGVSSQSKYPDESWEFIKYLSEKESMIRLYTEESKIRAFGEPYSRVDLAQTIINDPYVGAYIRQAQTAKTFFLASNTHDNGINDRMIKYLEDAVNKLSRGVTVIEALDTVAKGFAQVLSSFGYTSAR